jgi:hypothetical protein
MICQVYSTAMVILLALQWLVCILPETNIHTKNFIFSTEQLRIVTPKKKNQAAQVFMKGIFGLKFTPVARLFYGGAKCSAKLQSVFCIRF